MKQDGAEANSRKQAADEQHICKNCEAGFVGHYCPECGQSVKNYDQPLKFFLVDFAANLFAFDTRVWRTLSHVFLKPGKMESEYVAGKRRKYMPPFRLYVFVSFFFFLLLTYVSNQSIQRNKEMLSSIQINNSAEKADRAKYIDQLEIALKGKLSEEDLQNLITDLTIPDTSNLPAQKPLDLDVKMGRRDLNLQYMIDNPEIFISRFYKLFSWALFLLMPFYGMLLWLFFQHRKGNYMPHFVISANQHVFIFLIFSLIMLTQILIPDKTAVPENYLAFLIPVYAFIGAKRFYRSRWYSVLFRLIGVFFIYLFVTMLTTVAVLYFAIT
jgi:hypothetical protein